MASRFARANARANRVMMDRLSDGLCTYTLASGAQLLEVPYQLDLDHEVYDQDQVAMRRPTVLVPVERVPTTEQGDLIITPTRTWTAQQVLEDDGYWRRIYVS